MIIKNAQNELLEIAWPNLDGSADLSEANLKDAILRGADLSEANLKDAILRWADLYRTNLEEANLRWANLRWADLRRAWLVKANLTGAILSNADLRGANLKDAILSGADLSGANLSRAYLSGADLSKADLKEANLSRAIVPDGWIIRQWAGFGSVRRMTTLAIWPTGQKVWCGCFTGTVDEFAECVEAQHANNTDYLDDYRLIITHMRHLLERYQ